MWVVTTERNPAKIISMLAHSNHVRYLEADIESSSYVPELLAVVEVSKNGHEVAERADKSHNTSHCSRCTLFLREDH